MINNTQDIYNIGKTVSITGVSVFLCWAIFYLGMVLRQLYRSLKGIVDVIERIDQTVASLKDKIEHSMSYILLINEGVKKLIDVIRDNVKKE